MKWSLLALCMLTSVASTTKLLAQPLEFDASVSSIFQDHCTHCHGEDDVTEGEVNLLAIKTAEDLRRHPKLLETIIEVVDKREMPPPDESPLPDRQRKQLLEALRPIRRQALKDMPFEPTPIRRMNRFQYNNAVVDLLELDRDLFQLNERLLRRREDYFHPATRKMPNQVRVSCRPLSKDIDNQRPEGFRGVAAFPQDQRAEHGFDNRADHLSLSPLLMESFLQLSQTIAESPDLNPDECRTWDKLFARPGSSVRSPANGRYEAEQTRHMRIAGKPSGRPARQVLRSNEYKWSKDAHLFWRNGQMDRELSLTFETTEEATGLRLQFTRAPDYGTFEVKVDGRIVLQWLDLYDTAITISEQTVAELPISPGEHELTIRCVGRNEASTNFYFGLDYLELLKPESLKPAPKAATPTTDPAADLAHVTRERLKWLLRRAFRRPVDASTLERFTAFALEQLEAGSSYEQTMRSIVGAAIASPEFLYLYESSDQANSKAQRDRGDRISVGRQVIGEFELATRLAQFFWSSIPDDELLDLAGDGKLSSPQVLSQQIDRMMDDQRSSRFCDNFPSQWLQLDRLVTAIPDREKYPYFYYQGYRSSMHMMSEPLLLFETVFVEDRSVMELIAPDFTWESNMLRANYEGRSNVGTEVQVQTFRRVPVEDPRRGGVILNAAVMTMTSTPTRTQPITRGAWMNAVIFNDPPEPPPADVPPLPEANAEELEKMTIRERLAAHRQREDCAGCHNQIDPLGFALENYGPTGIWRDKYENGRDVDVAGELFNQFEFKSAEEFKQLLIQEKPRFIRAFSAHLLSYALGRELGPADSLALDDMTEAAMSGGDSLRKIMKRVAMSEPFLHKNAEGRRRKVEGGR